MFEIIMDVLKSAMDDGNGGYAWTSNAESLYNELWDMYCTEDISWQQWNLVNELVKTVRK